MKAVINEQLFANEYKFKFASYRRLLLGMSVSTLSVKLRKIMITQIAA